MKIETDNISLETSRTGGGDQALMRAGPCCSHFAVAVRMVDCSNGAFYLAVREDDNTSVYLLALPSSKWKPDARHDGFTIVQRINPKQLIATADHHKKQEEDQS